MNRRVYKSYAPNRDLVVVNGDCTKLLPRLPAESIDVTITSPPYCMGKEYEHTRNVKDFMSAHSSLLPEIVRLTKDGGSICWQVGYHVRNGVVTPLDYLVHRIMSELEGVYLRNRIVWTYGHGLHGSKRFSGRHETILWYTKGRNYCFDLDAVRVPQKYPGKKHYKGNKRGKFSGNPLGKNPSDVWDIPNVKANHPEKTEHPCQFPVSLVQRLIRTLVPPGGTVLDPFMGVGSTAIAAILEDRAFLGYEIDARYAGIAVQRCRAAFRGDLKLRPDERPIYRPSPNEAVAIVPSEFIHTK